MNEGVGQSTHALTPREQECLSAVSRGLVTAQIAAQLDIRERTVESHIANIMRKLSCTTRSQAVAMAMREGILE